MTYSHREISMPQLIIDKNERVISLLKDYWENHKYFYTSAIFYPTFLDKRRQAFFDNQQKVASLALLIAKWFCDSSPDEWKKIINNHGFNNQFKSFDTAYYLVHIITALRDADPDKFQNPSMKEAIAKAASKDNREIIRSRCNQIRAKDDDLGPRLGCWWL
jgi:hypothetical protein